MAHPQNTPTILDDNMTSGLGQIQIHHPPGTFILTPASHMAIRTIGQYQQLLSGKGIDWGSGTGCLAIATAKIEAVQQVVGLEISEANVIAARLNARHNDVAGKVDFLLADSYWPYSEPDRHLLETFAGQTNFIVANPPSSEGDDGFEYRRLVLQGARPYLVKGGLVFLNISIQYGQTRIERLSQRIPEFVYGGVLASSDWQPFDLQRSDLLHCLECYVEEELRGGLKYDFLNPVTKDMAVHLNAQEAMACFRQTGLSPLTRWQTHLFRYSIS